jgi:hypothetical protein
MACPLLTLDQNKSKMNVFAKSRHRRRPAKVPLLLGRLSHPQRTGTKLASSIVRTILAAYSDMPKSAVEEF